MSARLNIYRNVQQRNCALHAGRLYVCEFAGNRSNRDSPAGKRNAVADKHVDQYGYTDKHRDKYAFEDGNKYSDADQHADCHEHGDKYADTNSHKYSNADEYIDTDKYGDAG